MMARFCTNCGASLNEGVRFCQDCGAKAEIQTTNVQEQAAPIQTEQQAEAAQPPAAVVGDAAPSFSVPQSPVAMVQQSRQQYIQPQPAPTVTPSVSKTKPTSALFYLGNIFLMGLPGVGLVLSILWGLNKTPSDKRSLARAMILFSIISITVCVAMAIMLFIYTQVVADLTFKILGFTIKFS